jgi:AcrR family transcriptional regulator
MSRYSQAERDQAMQENRRALLEAAAEAFAREGYHAANINRISQSAGYAKGTVYNYFESKQALMAALIEDTAALHFGYIADRMAAAEDAEKRLAAFLAAGFEFVTAYPARSKAIVNNLYGPDVGFREAMYQAYLPMFELVGREVLGPGIAQGLFRDLDIQSTTNLVMLVYLGVASQLGPDGKPWVDAGQVTDFVSAALRNS